MAITRANTSLDIRTCFVAFLSSRETYEHVTVLHLVGVIHSLPVGTLSGNLRPSHQTAQR